MADDLKVGRKSFLIWTIIIVGFLVAFTAFGSTAKVIPFTGYVIKTETVPSTETIYVDETYPVEECENVNMLYQADYGETSSSCVQNECANYNRVCTRTGSECVSSRTVCLEWNFWHTQCQESQVVCDEYAPGDCLEYKEVCASNKCVKYTNHCELDIKNQERQSATYEMELHKWDYDRKVGTLIETKTVTISPLDDKTVTWDYSYLPTESVGCWYKIINSPTKEECDTKIKTRSVPKTVPTTETKDVKTGETRYQTIFQAWFNSKEGNEIT